MISLIIVEDEKDTRESLENLIPWQALGIDNIYTAPNGLVAIDLCESITPDILLTDVRMPKMAGTQLALYIRERFPECSIIFLSGFSDKEYLKTAIKIGAISYLEKPINIEEVKAVITTAVSYCNNIKEKKQKDEQIQDMLSKSFPLLMQKVAVDIVIQQPNNDLLSKLSNFWQIGSDVHCFYTTLLIKFGKLSLFAEEEVDILKSNLLYELSKSTIFIEADIIAISGFLDSERLAIHCNKGLNPNNYNDMKIIKSIFEFIINIFDKNLHITMSIGKPVSNINDLRTSFHNALELLKRHFFKSSSSIIYNDDRKSESYSISYSKFEEFQEYLCNNQKKEAQVLLDNLTFEISQYQSSDIGYVKNIYYKLYQLLSETAEARNVPLSSIEMEGSYYWQEISLLETIFDINSYLKSFVTSFFNKIDEKGSHGRSVFDILQYIESNYSKQDLSIKSIAEYAHYDHYYLCKLFKKDTGKTINDYITDLRMEKAKNFLKQKNIKLYDIANMVGFNAPSYFTKLFKKNTNYTPSEYREFYLR